ncbi:MAG: glycosyltransferase [Muribaculum sp.]|nr:glycosyltransferase [Muribaculum sp.]
MTTFMMITRLLYDKGYTQYVEAASRVKARHPECRFVLLGSLEPGLPMHVPEEVVRADVDRGVIEYLGYQKDVVGFMKQADCIVHPSYYNEGMSRVLMEALALRLPAVTTTIPGCRELVEDGRTGFLCEPRSTDSLEEALEHFLNLSEEERRQMGERAREVAEERYDIRRVIGIYHSLTDPHIKKNC